MSEKEARRKDKARKRKEAESGPPPPEVATKEEYNIARWMRKNVEVKRTKFLSHTVEYFTACKAVDKLMDSPWAQPAKPGENALFTTRESIVEVLDSMLRHKLFHRARKIVVPESELKSKRKKGEKEKSLTPSTDEAKKPEKASKKDKSGADKADQENKASKDDTVAESSHAEGEKTDKETKKKGKEEGEKKKRKIRLDMHLEQRFVDGTDAYVWIYEPTPFYYYFFGFLVVIAVIAVCLFPLWPSSVRQGVYYLSLAAAGFLVFILALAVIRLLVFCIVWCFTLGYHHLWLLPNLTEDVGFMASFWPLYKYEYKGDITEEADAEDEDDEDENKEPSGTKASDSNKDSDSNNEDGDPLLNRKGSCSTNGNTSDRKNESTHSETESEGSQPSQTGKDFEIVDREEIAS